MTKKTAFDLNMIIGDVIKNNKDALKVFKAFGINCDSCSGKDQESIKTGAINHGIDPDELLQELNKL